MSAGEIIAVLDAGPLIHLDQLGSLRQASGGGDLGFTGASEQG